MSLPPGFVDELRTRLSLVQVVGRKVSWDMRKSNQGKGDWWAPCPFHQERTASFHVDDRQGFFYCFGCQAKGDAIGFVMQSENLGFMEAVELLAREAGMAMPAPDPQARQQADRRSQLHEALEQAAQWFRLQLTTAGGTEARAYLARRHLGAEAQARFGIGWAPEGRQALGAALVQRGIPAELLLAAGLTARPEGGGAPFDRFRGRITFPIRDAQGRCIGFGGRSLDPNARAKYLNSPQTELFDKGHELYNLKPAREAAGKGAPLIVAEGYMDVIALSEGGFAAAVAPLGTAITEAQLRLMWRIHDEPVIALDGDAAGLRAALRLVDLALPLVEAGKGLRFALLPGGQDPDEILRAGGPGALRAALEAAVPMVELLWRRETDGKSFDSPERRARLDRELRQAVRRITDPSIRRHYGEALNARRQELFRPQRAAAGSRTAMRAGRPAAGLAGWPPRGLPQPPRAETRDSALARLPQGSEAHLREALVLALLASRPQLLAAYEARLARLELTDPTLEPLRRALLAHLADQAPPDALAARLAGDLGARALDRLLARTHIAIVPALRPEAAEEVARACLDEELAKLAALAAIARELGEAVEDIAEVADEGLTWRLSQAASARNRAVRAEREDRTVVEVASNGVQLDRSEIDRAAHLFDEIERRLRGD